MLWTFFFCLLTYGSCYMLLTVNIKALKMFGPVCWNLGYVHWWLLTVNMLWKFFMLVSYLYLVHENCLVTVNTHALKFVRAFLLTFCSCSLLLSFIKHALKFFFFCLLTYGSCYMLLTVNINALKIVWACLLKFRSCSLMVSDNIHALKIFYACFLLRFGSCKLPGNCKYTCSESC